ncbi:MAG: twin-arginine translocase TatA/TatE family subunit [Bacteroidales bacterium]|nr:twin-arginine translocase TatA/TatE family subunit [Bacteroidales bacterium]
MATHLLFISGSEIFIVLLVVLLLFGSKKIPEVAKGLGKGIREFRRATDEIKKEITDTEISKDIKEIKDKLKGPGL